MTHPVIDALCLCTIRPCLLLFVAICVWQVCQADKPGTIEQKVQLEVGSVFVQIVQ